MLLASIAWAAPSETPVTVKVAPAKVKAGKSGTVAVTISIASGWHIFAEKPLVEGVRPSSLAIVAPRGLTLTVKMPAAKKVHLDALKKDANVYEGQVKATVVVAAAKDVPAGKQMLEGTLRYQACSEQTCLIPTKVTVKIPLEITK